LFLEFCGEAFGFPFQYKKGQGREEKLGKNVKAEM